MSAFARWIKEHRLPRIAAVVLTYLLGLTNILSVAIVVMTARAAGWRSTAVDVAVSLAILSALLVLTGDEPGAPAAAPTVLGAGALWGGALLAGTLLRRFQSVDLAVQTLTVLAAIGVCVASVIIPEPQAYWQPVLEGLIKAAGLPQQAGLPAGWLTTVATLMHGVIAASLLSTLVLALILGLWLDSDAAGAEWRGRFLELRLGRVLSLAAGVAAALLALGYAAFGGSLLLVLGTAFAAQGLAIVHWTAQERGWPRVWPLVLYAPLLLGAPSAGLVVLGLAAAGLVDNGFALRRRRVDVV